MITSSQYIVGHEQKDGKRYVVETHLTDTKKEFIVEYLASQKADYQAILDARKETLEVQEAEQLENTRDHTLREIVTKKLFNYINGFTDLQLKNNLSLTNEQVVKLRSVIAE